MPIFQYIDILSTPYEIYLADTEKSEILPTRAHQHYYAEIIYIYQGSISVTYGRKTETLSEGMMILLYPRVVHSIEAVSEGRICYGVAKFSFDDFYQSGSFSQELRAIFTAKKLPDSIPVCFSPNETSDFHIRETIDQLLKENDCPQFGSSMIILSLFHILLVSIVRIWNTHGINPETDICQPEDKYSFFNNILEYIDEHSNEHLSVQDLADKSNMSYSGFSRNFRKKCGRSCKEYIEYVRISKAHDMLCYTDHSISYISSETGFTDCSHFIKAYKKYYDITPNQQRKQKNTAAH